MFKFWPPEAINDVGECFGRFTPWQTGIFLTFAFAAILFLVIWCFIPIRTQRKVETVAMIWLFLVIISLLLLVIFSYVSC